MTESWSVMKSVAGSAGFKAMGAGKTINRQAVTDEWGILQSVVECLSL